MIPALLFDAIADEAAAFTKLAHVLGSKATLDPRHLLQRDIDLQPPTCWSPNRHCQLVEAADGWIAVNLAREDDRAAVAAWLECEADCLAWDAVVSLVPTRTRADLLERAMLLALPVAVLGEAPLPASPMEKAAGALSKPLSDMSVIDLSALWAGPLCGALLAEVGMTVIKVEDPARPDLTRDATPAHERRLNGRKQRLSMTLSDPSLFDAISRADVLITSARSHALARLGLTPELVFRRNPELLWVAITAHGFCGQQKMRVGFGDDCAAAGGLVGWGDDGRPHFLGDALADPLTGLRAAHLALDHVAGRQTGLIDVALAATAADLAFRAGLR
jgi:hypothetical protein